MNDFNINEIFIECYNYDYLKWNTYNNNINKYGVIGYLNELFKDLDVTKLFNNKQIITTKSFNYKDNIERYLRTLNKINNYIIYNKYFDKLLKRHIDNIEFEMSLSVTKCNKVKSSDTKQKHKKKTIKNEYILTGTTKDMFTGETLYIYDNLKTGYTVFDKSPDKLKELNKKQIKTKKEIKPLVPLEAMQFKI